MDPDKVLEEIRSLCQEAYETSENSESTACMLAAAFTALDEWLVQGGFLPKGWW